jgi:hypothetical protein
MMPTKKLLPESATFTYESERIAFLLDLLKCEYPREVDKFWKRYPDPLLARPSDVRNYISRINEVRIKDTLFAYLRFAERYRVRMVDKLQRFVTVKSATTSQHVNLYWRASRLRPSSPRTLKNAYLALTQAEIDKVRKEAMAVTGEEQLLVVNEFDGSSALSEIESRLYDPSRWSVVLHNGIHPYVLLLVGEDVTAKALRTATKRILRIRKVCYGKQKRGRPADIEKIRNTIRRLERGGRLKERAAELAIQAGKMTNTGVATEQVRISRIRAKLHGPVR